MQFMETVQNPHQPKLVSYRTGQGRSWGWILSLAQRALAEPGGGTTVKDRELVFLGIVRGQDIESLWIWGRWSFVRRISTVVFSSTI